MKSQQKVNISQLKWGTGCNFIYIAVNLYNYKNPMFWRLMQSVRKFKISLEPFALVPYYFDEITLTKPEAICSIYLDINQVFLFFSEKK